MCHLEYKYCHCKWLPPTAFWYDVHARAAAWSEVNLDEHKICRQHPPRGIRAPSGGQGPMRPSDPLNLIDF